MQEILEVWKSLKGVVECGENYEVSNYGNVRSVDRMVNSWNGGRNVEGKDLNLYSDKDGYLYATLQLGGNKKHYRIHRLVAFAFIKNIDKKPLINHKDGNKSNNNIDNLEWSTISENRIHAFETGLQQSPKGENHYYSILKESDVIEIFQLYKSGNYSIRKLASMFNVSRGAIDGIIYGKSWKHLNLLK